MVIYKNSAVASNLAGFFEKIFNVSQEEGSRFKTIDLLIFCCGVDMFCKGEGKRSACYLAQIY